MAVVGVDTSVIIDAVRQGSVLVDSTVLFLVRACCCKLLPLLRRLFSLA